MRIVWSAEAKISYFKILDYLSEFWSQKEVQRFANETGETIALLKENPLMFIASSKAKNVRKGFVNRKISLFYKVEPDEDKIDLLLFWDNRQNPLSLKY